MKRSYVLSLLFSGILFTGLILHSCIKEHYYNAPMEDNSILSVERAKSFFEKQNSRSMVRSGAADTIMLSPGDFTPIWDQAQILIYEQTSSVIVPIFASYMYKAVIISELEDINGNKVTARLPVKITQALVVVKEKKSERTDNYIVTLIPQSAYATPNATYRKFVNNTSERNFTGTALYSLLSGEVICANIYLNGKCTEDAFISASNPDNTATIAKIRSMVKNMYFIRLIQATRMGTVDMDPVVVTPGGGGGGGTGGGEIIVGGGGSGGESGGGTTTPGSGGGSGGGGTTPPPPIVAPNTKAIFKSSLNDTELEKIEEMIKKIMEKCIGDHLYSGLQEQLRGGQLTLVYDPNILAPNFKAGTITINELSNSSSFMHEMFHAYQAYNEIPETWNNSVGNIEIEAQIAKIRFMYDSNELEAIQEYNNNSPLTAKLVQLESYLTKNGDIAINPEHYKTKFMQASKNLYELDNKYVYNPNRDMNKNLNCFKKLTKDC